MERKCQETNCSNDEAGPLAPRPRENRYPGAAGVRASLSYEGGPSASISKCGSRDMDVSREIHDLSGAKTRTSIQVADVLDQKWTDAENKFRCEGCGGVIQESAMVFVLESKKAVCTKCALKRVHASKNSKSRSTSELLLKEGENDLLLIRDAQKIAKAVMRAGDFLGKRHSLPLRVSSKVLDLENKSGSEEDEGLDTGIRAPVYNCRTSSGQLPRALGDDTTSRRRKVRRASEPLPPLQRPKFDNVLMQTAMVSDRL